MNPAINQEIQLFRDFLDREGDLGILIGNHQSVDTYAAALSLYLSLTQSGKKVQIVSKKAPTVEVSSLVAIDRVKESFQGSTTKLVVALPYIKGEVEKVLFTEAPNTINFHLTAAPDRSITPFELSDVKLNWEGGAPTAIIAIGVGTIDEISQIGDANTIKIVNIDNFQGNTRFGEVVLVDESFSSLSEVVGKLLKDLALPMDVDIAQNILDGVLFATRNFTKPNTSPFAFEAASAAMYQGAQRKEEARRDQSFAQSNPSRQSQPQDRGSRDQGQDRVNRDQRGQQGNRPAGRVSDNDFPAMHMQGQRGSQNQNQNQNQGNDNRRMNNNPSRGFSNNPPRSSQPFTQNRNVNDIRNKIMEESRRPQPQFQPQVDEVVADAEVIEETPMNQPMTQPASRPMNPPIMDAPSNQPIEEAQMPEEQPYNPPANEDIPDDWLMPKVFKSSKNNN